MLYGLLRQTKTPDPPRERGYTPALWRELDDLFRGGYQIAARAEDYLPMCVGEKPERYKERLKLASYIGYFGAIEGVYASSLFGQPVAVVPAGDAEDTGTPGTMPEDPEVYAAFGRDADLRGTPFDGLLRCLCETGLVKGKALLAVDFPRPPVGAQPLSLAESDALGVTRPYAFEVPPEEMIEWEVDTVVRRRVDLGDRGSVEFEVGSFRWVVLRTVDMARPEPGVPRSAPVEVFKVWRRRPEDGRVVWEVYRTPPRPPETPPPRDEDDIPLSESGVTTFTEIPIVEVRVPETLWLGNVIGPLCKEHWRRRSSLIAAQQRALLVIPTVYLGSEGMDVGGAPPAEVAQDPSRGNDPRARYERQGYLALGKDDRLAFEAAPTAAFTVVDQQLKDLVDEIHRVSGRMAASISSTAQATARSGESKRADNRDFVTVLMALGALFRDAARRVYSVIASALGDDVRWTVHGLDRFDVEEDRAAAFEEALQLGAVMLPSQTARIELAVRTQLRLLPGIGPEAQAAIREETADALEAGEVAEPPPPPGDEEEDEPASEPDPAGGEAEAEA